MYIIWLFTLKKVRLQNLRLIFQVTLRIFDLQYYGQIPVKIELVIYGLILMTFRKLRSLYREENSLISIKFFENKNTFTV